MASMLVCLLLAGAVATAGAGKAAALRLWARPATHGRQGRSSSPGGTALVVVATLVVANLLVVSRKTAGAAALVPGVVGTTLVLGSALLRLAPSSSGGSGGSGAAGRSLAWLAPLGWAVLGAALVWAAVDPLPSHPFVTLCTAFGLLAVIAAGAAGAAGAGARPDPDPTLERRGARRL